VVCRMCNCPVQDPLLNCPLIMSPGSIGSVLLLQSSSAMTSSVPVAFYAACQRYEVAEEDYLLFFLRCRPLC